MHSGHDKPGADLTDIPLIASRAAVCKTTLSGWSAFYPDRFHIYPDQTSSQKDQHADAITSPDIPTDPAVHQAHPALVVFLNASLRLVHPHPCPQGPCAEYLHSNIAECLQFTNLGSDIIKDWYR